MAAVYLAVVLRGARKHGASLRPDAAGIRASAQAGVPLLVRTLSLRAILMIATAVAARLGDADIAAHQIILSLWNLLAFALDAIAIAGQAIIGRYLGAGDTQGARAACRRMVEWGIAVGVVLGVLVILTRPAFLPLFTSDSAVKDAALPALVIVALSQPISGIVFVLDGVLMGSRRRSLPRLGDGAHPGGLHPGRPAGSGVGRWTHRPLGHHDADDDHADADPVAPEPLRPLDRDGRDPLTNGLGRWTVSRETRCFT